MKTTTLAVFLLLLAAATNTRVLAAIVDLHLSVTPSTSTTGTWTVTADLGANSSGDLGLASFGLDVNGSSTTQGISIQKAAIVFQTNPTHNPPYSLFRTTGTIAGPNLTQIFASQDTVSAANNIDSSGLEFGDGLLAPVTSSIYGLIPARGPITIAAGRYTINGAGFFDPQSLIVPQVSPGTFFNLFPSNYAVDDGNGDMPPAGTVLFTQATTSVILVPAPEPSSLILLVIGSIGLIMGPRKIGRRTSGEQ